MKYALGLILVVLVAIGAWFAWQETMHDTDDVTDIDTQMNTTPDDAMSDMDMDDATPGGPGSTANGSVSAETSLTVDPHAVVVDLTGHNFAFDQKEIRVKQGDTVVVNFTSTDGFHDFKVDEFNAATARVSTGQTSSVTFVADKAGTFEYYCSVGSHRAMGMVGKLIVE
jgi:plastocyanin